MYPNLNFDMLVNVAEFVVKRLI